jgi:hypothetical protein
VKLVGLQQVLHPASLAVFPLVEPLRPAVGQVGDDVAGVDPIGSGFDPGDDPALAVPGLGSTPEVHVAAELELGWLGRAARGISRRRAAFKRLDLRRQGGVSGQAEDVLDGLGLTPAAQPRFRVLWTRSQSDRRVITSGQA